MSDALSRTLQAISEVPGAWLTEFLLLRSITGLGLCGVQRFAFTSGLLVNLRFDGLSYFYDARYCYSTANEALKDLAEWDGQGDPPGEWIKEKLSERWRCPRP